MLSARAARGDVARGLPPLRPRPLPSWLAAVADGRVARRLWRVLGLVGLGLVTALAALGPTASDRNPASALVGVVAFGGMLVASALLGPVWRRVDPLRTIGAALGQPPDGAIDRAQGYRSAGLALAAFALVTVAVPDRPLVTLALVLAYAAVETAAAMRWGSGWWDSAEPFAVLSGLFGRLAPVGRDAAARVCRRSPRAALARLAVEPRLDAAAARNLAVLLGVLVGAALFDAVSDSETWIVATAARTETLRLAMSIGGFFVALAAAVALLRAATGQHVLTPALVPLAAAWALPLYLGALLTEAPRLLALAGVPVAPDAQLLPAAALAWVQLALVVAGHVGAVVVGHDLAVASYDLRGARAAQFPLRAAVTASLLAAIWLRFALP